LLAREKLLECEDMKKLTIKKSSNSGESEYEVHGNIIEGTHDIVKKHFNALKGDVRLDLSGVTITNSLGIKEWIDAIEELPNIRLKLYKCPPSIVHTINMIPSFVGKGSVGSVIGTFYCTSCESNKDLEIKIGEDIDEKLELKVEATCDSCGQPDMQLEVSTEEYFEFLESA